MVEIKGLEKFAPKDFPGQISSTVFLGGCNFRCPYCDNVDLVLRPENLPTFPMDYFLCYLDARKDWLDGICVTGGEPLIHEGLEAFLALLKDRGLKVKLDTNGTFPEKLKKLILEGLIDVIAMDVKTSPGRYAEAAGGPVDTTSIRKSVDIIRSSGKEYFFRTTIVPELIDTEEIRKIGEMLKGAEVFQLQQFQALRTLDPEFSHRIPYPKEKLKELAEVARPFFNEVCIEGI